MFTQLKNQKGEKILTHIYFDHNGKYCGNNAYKNKAKIYDLAESDLFSVRELAFGDFAPIHIEITNVIHSEKGVRPSFHVMPQLGIRIG